jgi:hypothetical protein
MNKLSWIHQTTILLLMLSFQTFANADNLVNVLTEELDVSSSQAQKGAGAIFEYAKDNLDRDDFDTVAKGIPTMDSLLDAAPEADRDSGVGRMSRRLNDFDRELGDRAKLVDIFDQLGMDPEMIIDYLDVIYDYLDTASGDEAVDIMQDLFPDEF